MSILLATLIACFFLSTAGGNHVAAQPIDGERLDLAAITLSPSDSLLAGYQHLGAFDESLAAEAATMSSYLGFTLTAAELRELLSNAGWQRKYIAMLGLPSGENPFRSTSIIHSYITEYRDAAGAAAAFAVLENEQEVSDASDIEPGRLFGDETDLTLDAGFDSDNRQFRSLDLTFRLGPRIAGVTLIAYSSKSGVDPDQAFVEEMAVLLENRLLDPPQPGIGYSLARFDPGQAVTFDDAYFRRDDRELPLSGESASAAAVRQKAYGEADAVYQLFQDVEGTAGQSLLYSLTVYEFASEEVAAAWLADADDLIGANPYYGDLTGQPVTTLSTATTRAFSFAPNAGEANAVIVLARTGAIVHRVQLVPSPDASPVPLQIAEQMVGVQIGCSASGECIALQRPAELLALLSIPVASPAA